MKSEEEIMKRIALVEWGSLLFPDDVYLDEGEQAELRALYWVLGNDYDESFVLCESQRIADNEV